MREAREMMSNLIVQLLNDWTRSAEYSGVSMCDAKEGHRI